MTNPEQVIPHLCKNYPIVMPPYLLTKEKSLLYAVSIGYSKNPLHKRHLSYTYEFHEDF